ncbi:MAG: deoxyribose-phosphate aldolase [Ignavibacterium sp.]|nr:deoxyribose-phosphate aldolase [Ignavibacterium sp.]
MFNKDNLTHIINEFNGSFNLVSDPKNRHFNGKEIAGYIDHTLLKPDAVISEIITLCNESKKYGFASVCINPSYVDLCTKLLFGSTVKVCTVIGFPFGANETATKIDEAELAITSGATEIDMVLNIGKLKDNEQDDVQTEILSISELCHKNNVLLKVIIETSLLKKEEIVLASLLALNAKADFVKTSTGFSKGGATIQDVALMKFTVGNGAKIKASGGIRSYEDAVLMIINGASRIGTSSGINIVEKSASQSDY